MRVPVKRMTRNERTSKKIASLSGLILGAKKFAGGIVFYTNKAWHFIGPKEVKSLVGSLTTQAADKRKRKAKRKRK